MIQLIIALCLALGTPAPGGVNTQEAPTGGQTTQTPPPPPPPPHG